MSDKRVDIWNDILAGKKIVHSEWSDGELYYQLDSEAGLLWPDGRPADILVSEVLEAAKDYTIYENPQETIAKLKIENANLHFIIGTMKANQGAFREVKYGPLIPTPPIFHPDIGLHGSDKLDERFFE